ncbi:hypothetical protein [Candidatus Berkiella aquae]|uniref:Uncharacterized protein n=1 Tax=Candidatus Berkiella aquae TaxID=295108 RepID=A0A0Q9YHY4_9GAMM|nr:hypothetical protein [Candidatus Berkiella aquae]MCS5712779.1 hypothetical protein [Candidatus Berkiella aquae]
MDNKNQSRWVISFLSILIGSFIFIIAIPLFFGFPINYLPILIAIGGIVIAVLYRKFVKKD